MLFLFSFIVYPLSQNVPRDRSALSLREGKMCADVTAWGRPGRGKVPVCVEVIVSPLGRETVMGGNFVVREW